MLHTEIMEILNKEEPADNTIALSGYSGKKLIHALQSLTGLASRSGDDIAYLEIGVFQGLTLTSVASSNPQIQCFGVDNFSQFDPDDKNYSMVRSRLKEHTTGNGSIINEDFEDALLSLKEHIGDKKIGVYFIDGPHDYRSQYLCLEYMKPYLSDNAVIIIDDSNYSHVRRANFDWLRANPDFTLVFEEYTQCHPINMSALEEKEAREGWWDGVNIIYKDLSRDIERCFPIVDDSLELFYQDHLVHPAKYAAYASKILKAFSFGILGALAYSILFFLTPKPLKKRFRHTNV
jgi:hypothetical protein